MNETETNKTTDMSKKYHTNTIGFFRPYDNYGEFSNWYLTTFFIGNTRFISSEQAFMYNKAILFGDTHTALQILDSTSQKEIKDLGRKVANFSQQKWDEAKYAIMVIVNYFKFTSDPILKEKLLSTDNAYLFEDSPYDRIWGVGRDGHGQNLLGKALMDVRSQILDELEYDAMCEEVCDCLLDETIYD